MRLTSKLSLALLSTGALLAQTITPPPQPTAGPGGSDYPFASYSRSTKFLNSLQTSNGYYIYQPEQPQPATAPVALFIHGYDGNTTKPYEIWMQHVAQMGYIVIWVEYDTLTSPKKYASVVFKDYQTALKTITSNPGTYVQPATDSNGNILSTVFGHSAGATLSFQVADMAAMAGSGVAPFKSIVAVETGEGAIPVDFDVSAIPASTQLVMVVGDEDSQNTRCLASQFWGEVTQIPASNRDFLEAITDTYGTPQQIGNHWFPLTSNEPHDTAAVDDRDYNITWKLSVGDFNCAIYGTQCNYGLGHGGFDQITMGNWSDGTPVKPLLWIQDPVSYFASQCAGN
jgi:hypothetical protein